MDLGIKTGANVLLVWNQPSSPLALKELAETVGAVIGTDGKISVENMEMLLICECFILYYDAIMSYFFTYSHIFKNNVLVIIYRVTEILYFYNAKEQSIS